MEKKNNLRIKGYKVFNPNFTCRGFKYEVGKTYKHDGRISLCEAGFHFCRQLKDCFSYYRFSPDNKVAEIIASGEVIDGDAKSVTNKIKIVREISWDKVLEMVNIGKSNTGRCNVGDGNSGNCNTGDRNTGNYNAGDMNTGGCNIGFRNTGNSNTGSNNVGNFNTGYFNTGSCNTDNCNAGNCNTGKYNVGNMNTGLFNSCNYSNGLFNSKSPKIYMFNKPTKLTYEEFIKEYADAYKLLYHLTFKLTEWVNDYNMSDEEKVAHPEYKTTGGYLKRNNFEEVCQKMWDSFDKAKRNKIKELPNFDRDVFKEITGIEVDSDRK